VAFILNDSHNVAEIANLGFQGFEVAIVGYEISISAVVARVNDLDVDICWHYRDPMQGNNDGRV
jgi:hypothetical protein